MNKRIIIIIGVAALAVVLVLLFVLYRVSGEPAVTSVSTSVLDTSGAQLQLPAKTGQVTVTTANFYKTALDVSGDTVTLYQSTQQGAIFYEPKTGSFVVGVNAYSKAEFDELRNILEQKLLSLTRTTPETLCQIKAVVTNRPIDDAIISDQELPLSFCK